MGKFIAFIFLSLISWCVVTLSDELGISNSSRWFDDWGSGSSYTDIEKSSLAVFWRTYATYDNGEWSDYTPPVYQYGEDSFNYTGEVVWTFYNLMEVNVERAGEELRVTTNNYKW